MSLPLLKERLAVLDTILSRTYPTSQENSKALSNESVLELSALVGTEMLIQALGMIDHGQGKWWCIPHVSSFAGSKPYFW